MKKLISLTLVLALATVFAAGCKIKRKKPLLRLRPLLLLPSRSRCLPLKQLRLRLLQPPRLLKLPRSNSLSLCDCTACGVYLAGFFCICIYFSNTALRGNAPRPEGESPPCTTSITQGIIDICEQHARGRRVLSLDVEIGELSTLFRKRWSSVLRHAVAALCWRAHARTSFGSRAGGIAWIAGQTYR